MHTHAELLAPPLLTIHIRYSLSPMQACIKKRNYFGIICTSYFTFFFEPDKSARSGNRVFLSHSCSFFATPVGHNVLLVPSIISSKNLANGLITLMTSLCQNSANKYFLQINSSNCDLCIPNKDNLTGEKWSSDKVYLFTTGLLWKQLIKSGLVLWSVSENDKINWYQ